MSIAVVVGVITGIGNVDESCKSIFVGLVGALLLHVVEMLLVGSVEAVGRGIARGAETCLTATDIDEQVDVVAGGVAMLLLQLTHDRCGELQTVLVIAPERHEVCQMTGGLGEDLRIAGAGFLNSGIVVELCHTMTVGPVAGVAKPVVGLRGCQAATVLQTVGQNHQPLIVFRLTGSLDLLHGPVALLLIRLAAARGSE